VAGRQGLEPGRSWQPTANYVNAPEGRSEEIPMNTGPFEGPFKPVFSPTLEKAAELLPQLSTLQTHGACVLRRPIGRYLQVVFEHLNSIKLLQVKLAP
jgi:hypothetical protein